MKSEILLIDDEKDIRFAVHEILKENNFFVREADTVEKAFSEIKKKLPDLIILDVLFTLPVFIMPYGGNDISFFTDPGFWLIAV